ncbi:putative bifunctional diguanylate cyclase/phosphodiesterase [Xanthobacteraceae bacterium A53D]
MAAGLVAVLVWAVLRNQEAGAAYERDTVRAFIEARGAYMLEALEAATDEASRPPLPAGAPNEVWFERNFSDPLHDTFKFEQNFILNRNGEVLFASAYGKPLDGPALAKVSGTLKELVRNVQGQEGSAGVVMRGPLSGLVAVRLLAATPEQGAAASPAREPVYAVAVDELNDDLFSKLGGTFDASAFRVAEGGVNGTSVLPLNDLSDGRDLSLVWPTAHEANATLMRVAPPVALLSTLLLLLCLGMLYQARRTRRTLVESEAAATKLASRDVLTGLPNRVQFMAELERAIVDLPPGEFLALMFIDLDGFKDINDTLGHSAGDTLLREAANRLSQSLGGRNVAARFGGDEFVLLARSKDMAGIETQIRNVLDGLLAPVRLEGASLTVGASIGVALAPLDATNVPDLLRRADIALYRAKSRRRGGAVRFEPQFERELKRRRNIELELAHALERNEFSLVFQPETDVGTRRIVGFEALLRWDHPERGRLLPSEFLWVAEGTSFITRIDNWVLRTACQQALPLGDVTLAVNMSPITLRHPGLTEQVMQVLEETGFPPHRLEIEITESAIIGEEDEINSVLARLRNLGIRLALDDFGTGNASLVHVRHLPVTKIKIDRSFIMNLGVARDAASIVEYVVRLGRSLGITLTAEGVETEEQLRFLRSFGAQQAQGYLFSAPLPIAAASAHLEANRQAFPAVVRPWRRTVSERLV